MWKDAAFQKEMHKWVDHVYEIMSHQNVSIFEMRDSLLIKIRMTDLRQTDIMSET